MRKSRFLVGHVLTFRFQPTKYISRVAQLPTRAKSGVLEPLVILEPLFLSARPFLVYVPVREFILFM